MIKKHNFLIIKNFFKHIRIIYGPPGTSELSSDRGLLRVQIESKKKIGKVGW